MSEKSLILYPLDSCHRLPPPGQLIPMLRDIGLIGESSASIEDVYKAGPRFLQWMTFSSSHSVVELITDGQGGLTHGPVHDSRSVCTLQLRYSEDGRPAPIVSCITEAPRCACGHREEEWTEIIGQWYEAPGEFRWTCPSCGAAADPVMLDWLHTAGFATDCLEIESIAPGEAVPSPELLTELHRLLSAQFGYTYYWL
jgi:hypothetical protein